MSKKYTEEQIQQALNQIRKKRPEHATREQAINFLDTLDNFSELFVDTAKKQFKKKKTKS